MSQKTDKMLKLALVFFISLLSFSVGTFVGKKYSDNQHKLALLEPQKAKDATDHDFATTTTEGKADAATANKDGADPLLTDSEVAKIAEEFATESETEIDTKLEKTIGTAASEEKEIKEITTTVKSTAQPKPLPQATAKPAAVAAVPKVTTAAAKTVTQATSTATTREVASIPLSASQYTVQVGSFPTQVEAQKLSQDLVNKGFKSSSVPASVNGQTWHRVHVGLFGSVKEAQDYKKDFLEKTKLSAAIVQRVK